MRLVLPLPISKNRLHLQARRWTRSHDGRCYAYIGRRNSPAYLAYLEEMGWEVCRQTTVQERETLSAIAAERPLAVRIGVHYPESVRRRDVANAIDPVLDAIKGPLGIDDERFWRVTVERVTEGPACVVEIEVMEGEG